MMCTCITNHEYIGVLIIDFFFNNCNYFTHIDFKGAKSLNYYG